MDGKTWTNVTPHELAVWSKISLIDAGHFDAGTAYAAVDRHRIDDIAPYVYRTHDFGKTWTRINSGIPEGAYVRAVREDPVRKGTVSLPARSSASSSHSMTAIRGSLFN